MIPKGNLLSVTMDSDGEMCTHTNLDNDTEGEVMEVAVSPLSSLVLSEGDHHEPLPLKNDNGKREIKRDVKSVTKSKQRRVMTGAGGSKKSASKSKPKSKTTAKSKKGGKSKSTTKNKKKSPSTKNKKKKKSPTSGKKKSSANKNKKKKPTKSKKNKK